MRLLYVCLAAGGCASAGSNPGGGGDDTVDIDASVRSDSSSNLTDASVVPTVDAPPGPCTVVTKNLLKNPAFEVTPAGTDWVAAPISANYPLITDTGGIGAQSVAYRAWMAGIEQSSATNKDSLYQDVLIPPTTTKLELTGYYEVRTAEVGSSIYDRATVELTNTSNVSLELVKALDDNGPTTAWTPFSKIFTGQYSNMTVRVRLSTASDVIDATSFYFDTLALNATACQ